MASKTEEDAARIIIGEEHFPALNPTSRILGKWGRVEGSSRTLAKIFLLHGKISEK